MLVTVTFLTDSVRKRFIEWVAEGNARSLNSFGGSGIKGHFKVLEPNKFLFFWETNNPFGDYYFLRLVMLWTFRKRRKELKVKRISKEDLARIVLNGTN